MPQSTSWKWLLTTSSVPPCTQGDHQRHHVPVGAGDISSRATIQDLPFPAPPRAGCSTLALPRLSSQCLIQDSAGSIPWTWEGKFMSPYAGPAPPPVPGLVSCWELQLSALIRAPSSPGCLCLQVPESSTDSQLRTAPGTWAQEPQCHLHGHTCHLLAPTAPGQSRHAGPGAPPRVRRGACARVEQHSKGEREATLGAGDLSALAHSEAAPQLSFLPLPVSSCDPQIPKCLFPPLLQPGLLLDTLTAPWGHRQRLWHWAMQLLCANTRSGVTDQQKPQNKPSAGRGSHPLPPQGTPSPGHGTGCVPLTHLSTASHSKHCLTLWKAPLEELFFHQEYEVVFWQWGHLIRAAWSPARVGWKAGAGEQKHWAELGCLCWQLPWLPGHLGLSRNSCQCQAWPKALGSTRSGDECKGQGHAVTPPWLLLPPQQQHPVPSSKGFDLCDPISWGGLKKLMLELEAEK